MSNVWRHPQVHPREKDPRFSRTRRLCDSQSRSRCFYSPLTHRTVTARCSASVRRQETAIEGIAFDSIKSTCDHTASTRAQRIEPLHWNAAGLTITVPELEIRPTDLTPHTTNRRWSLTIDWRKSTSFSQHHMGPDLLYGPPSHLLNGYRVSFTST
jgi:hypothetical protein